MFDGIILSLADLWTLTWPALAIAALRIGDVTINVIKTVCIVEGRRPAASAFAGLEAGVWLAAAGITLADLSPERFIGFVVGVAAGTYIGMLMVRKAKMGTVTVRVFAPAGEGRELAGHVIAERIRRSGHGATLFNGWGQEGEVQMVLSVVRRKHARAVCKVVADTDPQAAVAIDNDLGPVLAAGSRARV